MSNFNYDAAGNIEQTISTGSIGSNFGPGTVINPLTNAAINGNVSPTGAPNAFSTTNSRDLGPKTSAFSVSATNGSGQVCAVITNPA